MKTQNMNEKMNQEEYRILFNIVERNRTEELEITRVKETLRSESAKSCVERVFGGCVDSALLFIKENIEAVRYFQVEARVIDGYISTDLQLRPGEEPDYYTVMNALREDEFVFDLEYVYNEDLLREERAIIFPRLKPFNECVFKCAMK